MIPQCLQVFHLAMLARHGTLPASHTAYYSLYTAAMLCLLAWQRSGRPSYAAWRDWVQVSSHWVVSIAAKP